MTEMGGISFHDSVPFYVEHLGSVAVVYGVKENEAALGAVRGIVEAMHEAYEDGKEPLVVVIDQNIATIHSFPREKVIP